jgi:glycosyltransferase involved in cell wall biosynthesis
MLSYEFPPLGGGGAKVVYGLSSELVKLGHGVDLVTMGFQDLPKYEQINGVNVHRIQCIRAKESVCSTPEMGSYVLSAIPAALRLMRRERYQINHTHFIFPDGLVSSILKKIAGLPYIIIAHGSDVPGYNPNRFKLGHKLLSAPWRKVTQYAEQIFCPSESFKSLVLVCSPGSKVTVIPNGIDKDKFQINGNKKKRILLVSRMFERKGIQYFLRALERLELEHEVNIVGDGPYLRILRQLANNLKVKVRFWGWLENTSPELKELFETSSIFAFTSESENFPIVLLQAMTAGMAIITTKDTGCAEVIGDCGLLVESRNPLAIREALSKLINNPDFCKELGQGARGRLESNFSWTAVAGQYAELYEKYANNQQV